MPIPPPPTDVQAVAQHFAGACPAFARLVQAVVIAEGNLVAAVSKSVPTILDLPPDAQRAKALEIVARSAVHAMTDFLVADPTRAALFVSAWGARWAPIGAANDPTGLNRNWTGNVYRAWDVRA